MYLLKRVKSHIVYHSVRGNEYFSGILDIKCRQRYPGLLCSRLSGLVCVRQIIYKLIQGYTINKLVCVLSSHLFWTSDLTCGRISRGHTGRSHRISPPSSCDACHNFIARKIQSSLALVDCKVEFCVPRELPVLYLLSMFLF